MRYVAVSPEKIVVIHNGANCPALPSLEFRPDYFPQKPFLFSIGTINPKKNWHVILPLLKYYEGVYESLALTHKNKMDLFLFCLELSLFTVFLWFHIGVLKRYTTSGDEVSFKFRRMPGLFPSQQRKKYKLII